MRDAKFIQAVNHQPCNPVAHASIQQESQIILTVPLKPLITDTSPTIMQAQYHARPFLTWTYPCLAYEPGRPKLNLGPELNRPHG